MKTLHLGLEWFPERAGGLPRYFHDVMRAAPPHFGFEGLVLGSERIAEETGGRVEAFARSEDGFPTKMSGLRRTMRRRLAATDPDVVVSHFALFALPVLDMINRPHVVHFQGPWAAESAVEGQDSLRVRIKRMVETAVYRRAGSAIVLSEAFATILTRDYGVAPERIQVIPGGVDVVRFDVPQTRSQARDHLRWPNDRPILLAVRRLVRRMGLDVLIEAMAAVVRMHPDALLLIAGRGPMAKDLQTLIDERGLGDHVRLLGFVPDDDLPIAYRAADLSVVPTQALEGFGLIAVESLAAGTPAAVTPVGGLPEIVGPLSPDLVFENASAAGIADGILRLLQPGGAPTASACRAHAAGFDWGVIIQRLAVAYGASR
ncbi:glycosyltransferase family 4 protein [Brevundimonas sp. NIBR11]|uniref:glycosyltransferase family 4 protein n=1 Tax=Brevundimonas sp. NIBR11 TaxID=3015999 RepID=UPI0022F0B2A5|nr:glycosyltransferase family 4 protein [Brevundimonas sp. NIBR11]WGM31833.1 D-inositol-3-phosphate glycosyltransferase [Brevundimonas sp. NIBR11]